MHTSGLEVSQEIKDAFVAVLEDTKVDYVKVQIVDEEFKITGTGAATDSPTSDWEQVAKDISDEPVFYVKRATIPTKWIMIFFVPEVCKVKQKMVYASSSSSLKDGLGSGHFVQDYHISTTEECTLKEYTNSIGEVDQMDLLTMEEIMAKEAEEESQMSIGGTARHVGIQGIPVQISEAALAGLADINEGKITTCIFNLNPETEVLEVAENGSGNLGVEAIASFYKADTPSYTVFAYAHEHEGVSATKNVFIYYCPDAAKPRLKMFYSSVKADIVTLCSTKGVSIDKQVEMSELQEVNAQYILEDLYPKSSAKKTFKKPSTRGRRKLVGGAKFKR